MTRLRWALIQGPVICNALLRLNFVVVGPDWLLALIGISLQTQPMESIHVGSQNLPVYPR